MFKYEEGVPLSHDQLAECDRQIKFISRKAKRILVQPSGSSGATRKIMDITLENKQGDVQVFEALVGQNPMVQTTVCYFDKETFSKIVIFLSA